MTFDAKIDPWDHLSDKDVATEIKSRISEVNDLIVEASRRDMIVAIEQQTKGHHSIHVTVSQKM